MGLTDRHRNAIFNTLVILIATLISYNMFYKSGLKAKDELIIRKNDEIKKNMLLKDIIDSENKIKVFKDSVNNKDLSLMLKNISTIAKESSVDLISLKPQNEKEYTNYKEYSYNLVVAAPNYHRLGQFISNLENSPDVYTINNLSLRPESSFGRSKSGSKGIKLSVNVALSTIVIK